MFTTREVQVQHMLRALPAIQSAGPNVFEVPLRTMSGVRFVVRVHLDQRFPQAPPKISIPGGTGHPWLDSQGNVVGCTEIFGWSEHSSLATTVSTVVNQFMQNPPQIAPAANYNARYNAPYPYNNNKSNNTTPYPNAVQQNTVQYSTSSAGGSASTGQYRGMQRKQSEDEHVALPPIPDKFDCLEDLTLEQLVDLRDNEQSFEALVTSLPLVQSPRTIHQDMARSNRSQAEQNLAFKPTLDELGEKLNKLKILATQKKKQLDAVVKRQNAVLSGSSKEKVLKELREKAEEMDQASETVANGFLGGEIGVVDFIKQYIELRQLYHLRQAKASQLRQQLRRN